MRYKDNSPNPSMCQDSSVHKQRMEIVRNMEVHYTSCSHEQTILLMEIYIRL